MTLTDIAQRHDEWIAIAVYLGAPSGFEQDIVQDLYIKLHTIQEREGNLKRLTYNGQLNTAYIFSALGNMITSIHRKSKEKPLDDVSFDFDASILNNHEEAFKTLLNAVRTELNNQHWYDRKLLKVYLEEGHSIRSLARATNISAKSIFITLKNVREKIKNNCEQEYQEYKEEKRKTEGERIRGYRGENYGSDWD